MVVGKGLLRAGLYLLLLSAAGYGLWISRQSSRQSADSQRVVQQMEQRLREARGETDKQLQELKRVNDQLSADLERTRADLATARQAAEQAQKEGGSSTEPAVAAGKGTEKEWKAAVKQKEQQIAQLSEQLAAAQKQDSRSRAQLDELTDRVKQLEAQNHLLRKKADEGQTAAQQVEHRVAKEREEASRQVEQARRALAQAEQQRDRLAQQVNSAQVDRKEMERLQRELAEANDRIADLIVALDQQEKLVAQMSAERSSNAAP